MVGGWLVGGLERFSVSPRLLSFGFGTKGFGAKGLGPGLDNLITQKLDPCMLLHRQGPAPIDSLLFIYSFIYAIKNLLLSTHHKILPDS